MRVGEPSRSCGGKYPVAAKDLVYREVRVSGGLCFRSMHVQIVEMSKVTFQSLRLDYVFIVCTSFVYPILEIKPTNNGRHLSAYKK